MYKIEAYYSKKNIPKYPYYNTFSNFFRELLILKICHWTFLVKPFNKTRFWKSSAKISLKNAWNFLMNCMRTKMPTRNSTSNLARIWNWASTRTLPTVRNWPASWDSSLPLPEMSPAAWETTFQGNLTIQQQMALRLQPFIFQTKNTVIGLSLISEVTFLLGFFLLHDFYF